MKLIVQKSVLSGEVPIPGSKSHTIRALAIAALAGGVSTIRNPLVSDDTLSAVTCYRALGAKIDTVDTTKWLITGTAGQPARPAEPIDVGNSGTTLRIAAASAALAGADEQNPIILTGDAQIQSRPIGPLLTALTDLGAQATALKGNGKAPIAVCSRLAGGKTTIECTTSQYLSSLLLAAPLAETDTEIHVSLLNEPDYVQMTLDWLDRQGIEYENKNMQRFRIRGGQKYKAFDVAIAADFSSATFFFCAAALTAPLGGHVKLTGLDFSDSQPDKAVADYLRRMGADIRIESDGTYVGRSALKGIEIDMNRTPDALPAMAVTAA
ncbi:MAG: 3-phosphoshikimate 1-carboxyvinyltransferase, partial [Planctomycetes bacterium]|nr:3-phosphoshikimate 1-carboxyvinyltransferase [Planctomycetota bacterium]